MRVIAGEFRSRRLLSLPGLDTRPTPDKMRETLFNILAPAIGGATFVDAYAGTGAVGIEAISRGAKLAVFIEKDRDAVDVIKANLNSLGIKEKGRIIRGMAAPQLAQAAATLKPDIVFLDPPYPSEAEYTAALAALAGHAPALTVAQHAARYAPPDECEGLVKTRTVRQGNNALSFYKPRG